MEPLLQFIYLGEGSFSYERMGEFIKITKDLEVKEISKGLKIPNLEKDVIEETTMDDEEYNTGKDFSDETVFDDEDKEIDKDRHL